MLPCRGGSCACAWHLADRSGSVRAGVTHLTACLGLKFSVHEVGCGAEMMMRRSIMFWCMWATVHATFPPLQG